MSEELIAALMAWAVNLSGYPLPTQTPDIELVSHKFFVKYYCEGQEPCNIKGWYPGISGSLYSIGVIPNTIYLDDQLNPEEDTLAASIVVHEFVHYLQDQEGSSISDDPCVQFLNDEREAYEIQRKYLQKYKIYSSVGLYLAYSQC